MNVLGLLMFLLALGLIQWYCFPDLGEQDMTSVIPMGIIFLCVVIALVYQAVKHFQAEGSFELRLDGSTLTCHLPIPAFGKCFEVDVWEIVKLEQEYFDDGVSWYVTDRAGNRHQLPAAYGTPTQRFADAIRERIPLVPAESAHRNIRVWVRQRQPGVAERNRSRVKKGERRAEDSEGGRHSVGEL